MADKKLNIILGATDKASSVIKGVRGEVKGLASEAGRGVAEANRNLQRGVAIAAGALTLNVVAGVQSLTELAEVQNQTAAAIASTGGAAHVSQAQIRAQAEELERLSTVDDKVIQRGQNMLLTFTSIQNRVGKGNDIFNQATETALDMSVALGTDIKDSAIQLGKALNDPIRGVTALRRVGVQFTDDQQKQIKTLVESGDLLSAQKMILRELNTEFGGSAAAFGKGPGATMRRFADAVEDGQQALATGFLPLMEKVSQKAQDIFSDPKVIAGITEFGEFVAGKLDQGIGFLEANWDTIANAFNAMGTGARLAMDAFTSAPPWLQTAILTGWGLNKLTGGALGNIVGSLGSGLIKGVLGMNAGVVNAKAGVVNVSGGITGGGPGAGGGTGGGGKGPSRGFNLLKLLGFAAAGATGAGIGVEVGMPMFEEKVAPARNFMTGQVDQIASGGSLAQMQDALKTIEGEMGELSDGLSPAQIAYAFDIGGFKTTFEEQKALLQASIRQREQQLAAAGRMAASSDQAMLQTAQVVTEQRQQKALAAAALSSDRAMLQTASTQTSHLATIKGIESGNSGTLTGILQKKSTVTAVINTTVNVSLQEWQRKQISSIRASAGSGGFI